MRYFIWLAVVAGTLCAADIDLDTLEALAIGNRAAAIASLPPGSAEQWYWRVVQAQLADPASAVALIDEAAVALPDDQSLIRRLRLRQAALTWDSDARAGDFLDHELAATVAPVAAPDNAIEAAPMIAALDAFVTDREADTYTADGLARLMPTANGARRHAILSRLHDPRAAGLVEALAAEAADHPEQPFGSLPVHQQLTAHQLAALALAVPAFTEQIAYVRLVLQQCADAHAQSHWQSDAVARRRYAEALLDLAKLPHLAWVAVAAHDELLLLDADPGAPGVERIVAWYTATNLAHLSVDSLPLSEIRLLTGLPERDTDRLRELSVDRLLATEAHLPAWVNGVTDLDTPNHHALARMLAGRLDPALATAALGGPVLAQSAKEKRELEWWPAQATTSPSEAPISVRLSSKHLEHVAVRLWQLDEAAVLRHGGKLEIGIDLAGMAPTAQLEVALSTNPWLRQETLLPLPQIDAPGTWLIEALGNDRAVRLLVRRGAVEVVISGDGAGNRAVVIDEQGRVQKTAQVWLDGLCVAAGTDGMIRLPDGRGTLQRLVACAAGRACATTVTLPAEDYQWSPYVLTAHEQLLAGTTVRLVVGARLVRNHIALPPARLSEPTLTLRWSGRNHRALGVQTTRVHLGDDHDAVVPVNVPEDAMHLDWSLEATVAMHSRALPLTLTAQGRLELSPGLANDTLGNSLMRRADDGWHIAVRGRAGEPLVEQVVDVAVQNELCRSFNPPLSLRTDAAGEISLGPVIKATRISVQVPGADTTYFHTGLVPSGLPADTLLIPGETLALPRSQHPRVFRVAGIHFLAEFPAALHKQTNGWSLSLAQVGDYRILDGEQTAEVTVRDSTLATGLRLGVGFAAEVPLPAAEVTTTVTPTSLELDLSGLHAGARVHLLPLRLWPALNDVQIPSDEDLAALIHTWMPAGGASGTRPVDAEEWYSLNRRQQAHVAGVMLDRPGVLLDPWSPHPTVRSVFGGGGDAGMFGSRDGGEKKRAVGKTGGSKASLLSPDQHLAPDWLASALPLMDHLRPDAHGHLSIPLTRLSEAVMVIAVATDGHHLATAAVALPHAQLPELPLRERRLQQILPAEGSVGITCGLSSVATGKHLDLPALPGSGVRVIDTVATFIELLQAGWPDLDLGPFAQLGGWATLDAPAKYRFWESAASHELHLFLQRHDPAFAAEVLTPYRRQMLVPDAMLTALCGGDAQTWLRAGVKLNPLERLLLAQRLPADQGAPFLRQVADAAAGVSPDPSRRTAIIEAWLAGTEPADPDLAESKLEQVQDDLSTVTGGIALPLLRHGEGEPKTWIDARWWQCPQPPHIADGPLWAAYAGHVQNTPFLPVTGLEHLHTASELRLLLALTDLPFAAPPSQFQNDAQGLHLTAASPLLVAHRLVQPLPRAEGTVSLYRRTCRLSEWRTQPATAMAVADHLTSGEAYVDEVVAVNLSPLPVDVGLLTQIPRGATALGGDPATAVQHTHLAGYASTTLAVRWYLPQHGATTQAAASVTVAGAVVAMTPQREWTTTAIPIAPLWTYASSGAVVLAGLAQQRLDLVDLVPVAARCADPEFFVQAVAALRARGAWLAEVWAWALRHHDTRAANEWLSGNGDFRIAAGPWLRSPLITCDALAEQDLTMVEISPLVNPRRHRVQGSGHELQTDVRQAWSNALRYVAHKIAPDARDRLMLTCLLLAQDRVEEAMPLFTGIDPTKITARIQYDWCQAWLALARGDLALAQRLADAYRQQPIPRWQQRWNDLRTQLAEINGQTPVEVHGPAADLAAQAVAEPTLRLEREAGGGVVLTAHAATAVVLGFRPLDVENLFDRDPFAALEGQMQRLCAVTASQTQTLTIAAADEKRTLTLPPAWRNRTAVIEAVAGGAQAIILVQANDLEVHVASASGSLTVIQRSTGKAVPAAYVKVMRRQGETVSFLKDGYTDRRGRFDHVAVNGEPLPAGDRFAILVEAGELGATVVQANGVQAGAPRDFTDN